MTQEHYNYKQVRTLLLLVSKELMDAQYKLERTDIVNDMHMNYGYANKRWVQNLSELKKKLEADLQQFDVRIPSAYQ